MPLSNTSLLLRLLSTATRSIDLQTGEAPLNFQRGLSFANGVLANQADLLWTDNRTIAPSGTDDLDLAGTLADVFGQTVSFARVKGIIVVADPTNTNDVVIGAAASNAFVGPFGSATHTMKVQPGNPFCIFAAGLTAWPVTPTTADLLRIANGGAGTSVTYDIAILGASA